MKLYSYVVIRDYGFAPNPFYGYCTLATCKPDIRKTASVDDIIIGTGSRQKGLGDKLIYYMQVSEIISFNEYWNDERFLLKRPYIYGSRKQAIGDNIYHQKLNRGKWIQEDSHHSRSNGGVNYANVKRDTKVDKVLIGKEFIYWGSKPHQILSKFLIEDDSIALGWRGHKCKFSMPLVEEVYKWLSSFKRRGYIADPTEFHKL